MIPLNLLHCSKYYFNPHALPLFVAAGLIALLGGKVVASRRSRTNLFFGAICLGMIVWLFFTALGYLVRDDKELATFWFRLDWVGVSYISVSVYTFAVHFLAKKRLLAIRAGYVLASFFAVLTLVANPMMLGVRKFSWGFFALHDYFWSPFFFVFFFGYMLMAFGEFIAAYRRTTDPIKRNQIKYIFAAFVVAYLGSIDFLPTYGIPAYPLGFVFISLFVALTSYAILRHHLMDITIVIKKTLLYSIVSAGLASAYVGTITLLAQVLGGQYGSTPAFSSGLAAIFITLLFNPLRMRTQRWIERHFPREHLDPELLQEAAGGYAHEMKRPLSKISLPAELALMDLDRVKKGEILWMDALPKVEERLQFILNQSIDAGYMIEAIRELSASSAAPLESVNVLLTLEDALQAEKDLLEKRSVSLHLDLPTDLPFVSGRAKQLEIVFVNLIKNAVEAINELPPGRSREIRIEAQANADQVLIRVKDTGPGIKPEDIGKIFQPHYTSKGPYGSGMGLYLTNQIIQAHGGTIEVSSQTESGTTFTVRLPFP